MASSPSGPAPDLKLFTIITSSFINHDCSQCSGTASRRAPDAYNLKVMVAVEPQPERRAWPRPEAR